MKNTELPARLERVAVVVEHTEVLADEAADAGLYESADRLRLESARLAIEIEEAEARLDAIARARAVRTEQFARLRQTSARMELEIEARLPAESAAALVTGARLSPESAARFRLRRLSAEERALLGGIVDECSAALRSAEHADEAAVEATASAFVARVRAVGHAHALRRELERVKAAIVAVLPVGCDAARRVRRRVVRTRRAERFGALVPSAV